MKLIAFMLLGATVGVMWSIPWIKLCTIRNHLRDIEALLERIEKKL